MKIYTRTKFGILMSVIMLMQMLAPCVFAAGSNSVTIKSEQITAADTSITVNIGNAVSGGFMRILELEADDEYSADNFFSYTSLATVGFASIKAGDNTVTLDSAPTAGKKLIAVLRDTSEGTMAEYVSNAVTVTQAQVTPANAITIVTEEITPETTEITVNVQSAISAGLMKLIELPVDEVYNSDNLNSYTQLAVAYAYTGGIVSGNNIMTLTAAPTVGKKVIAVLRDASGDVVDYVSEGVTVVEYTKASVTITSSQVTVDSTSVSVSAQFDGTALLTLYKYSGNTFSPENFTQEQRNDYAAIMFLASSPVDTTVNLIDGVSLTAGEKLAAVLWTNLYGDLIAKSEPVEVADAAPLEEPIAYIRNGEKLTAGQTQVTLTTIYDIRCTDVTYTLYQFEGDVPDKSTGEIIISGKPNNNTYDTYYIGTGKLTAGHKLQLSLIADGVEALSNIVTVLPSPDYGTPTIAINDEYITPDTTEVTVTATYDDGYLEMEGYYSNITLYQCPIDSDTTSDEFWEQSWAKRVGSIQNSRGEVTIPVSGLEAGNKLVAKLRLPHAEWEGEEVDYISMPAYILEEGQTVPKKIVLLYNLGEDTSKGTKLAEIFNELDIEIKNITTDMLGEKVGYLAELDGYTESETKYEGDAPDTQFMLMCNLGEALLDKVLAAMRENNVTVNHKAILTMYNRDSQFYELIGDIESEHKEFQAILALDKIIKEGESLNSSDYDEGKWTLFAATLEAAQNTLSSEAAQYEDYLSAYMELRKSINTLNDINTYTEIKKSMELVIGHTQSSGQLLIGYYKDDQLLRLDNGGTVKDDFTCELLNLEEADTIQVFLWESLQSMVPLCASQTEDI